MPDRDPVFLWETEALRESPRGRTALDPPAAPADARPSWATLREAHHATGIPIDTLRKWARKGAVPSFLDDSGGNMLRMVRMDAVLRRAEDLGRPIEPVPPPAVRPPGPPSPISQRTERSETARPQREVESRPNERPAAGSPPDRTEPDAAGSAAPDGTMIVPIAAWDKMLMQLGNLHEAGQQLAEARERAARAETEASFLRERLAEMRRELGAFPPDPGDHADDARDGIDQDGEPDQAPPADSGERSAPPGKPEKLWRYIYRGWRERRRR